MINNGEPSLENATQVSYVGIKAPPFWKSNPALWFLRLEAQFSLAKINCETTKFNHVVAAVDADILTSVSDIIVTPPTANPYETLKKRLIESHSESEESRIRTLLQGVELGDYRPSQLLARMRTLAGSTVGEPLLKSLWLSRLPTTTCSIVGALSDDLQKLASVADKIHDLGVSPQINAASTLNSTYSNCLQEVVPTHTAALEAQIAQLTRQVSELSAKIDQRDRSGNTRFRDHGNRRRSHSRGRYKEASNNLCFYHTNFGSKAKKCIFPCSFKNQEN